MWLQHRGRWSVSSEATGERVELEFGCFGGAASGVFAAALADEAAEAARLLRESSEGGGGGGGEEPNEPPTPSSSSSSCAEAFETVGFAPGAALSDRDRAVAAKRRALREVRGRLMTSPAGSHQSGSGSCSGCCCRDKKGGGSGSCSGSHATGITLAGSSSTRAQPSKVARAGRRRRRPPLLLPLLLPLPLLPSKSADDGEASYGPPPSTPRPPSRGETTATACPGGPSP